MNQKTDKNFKEVNRKYLIELTGTELLERGQSAAKIDEEIKDIEYSLKVTTDRIKGSLKNKQNELREVLKVIGDKKEWREVQCWQVPDYTASSLSFVYKGEIMEVLPMPQDMKQTTMLDNVETIKPDPVTEPATQDEINKACANTPGLPNPTADEHPQEEEPASGVCINPSETEPSKEEAPQEQESQTTA